jgi:hypothetical protein
MHTDVISRLNGLREVLTGPQSHMHLGTVPQEKSVDISTRRQQIALHDCVRNRRLFHGGRLEHQDMGLLIRSPVLSRQDRREREPCDEYAREKHTV